MNKPVGFLHLEEPSPRLSVAERHLLDSITRFNLDPVPFSAGKKLVSLGDVLFQIRRAASGHAFVWCNTDVILQKDPFDVPDKNRVYGFHRTEVPSGEICGGIDMFYIPVQWWDSVLSKDVPELLIGASYVDWWIPRAMERHSMYSTLSDYIKHPSHPQSKAANSDGDSNYQHNFRAFNRWAGRNHVNPIQAPGHLVPFVGHVWGFRHLMARICKTVVSSQKAQDL